MNTHTEYTRLDSFRLWLAHKPLAVHAALVGGIFALLSAITYLFIFIAVRPEHREAILFIYVSTIFIGGFIFAVSYVFAYGYQLKRIGSRIGLPDVTRVELVELSVWFRRGIYPLSTRAQAVENAYLDYLQPFIEGKTISGSKKLSIIMIVIIGFNVVISFVNLFTLHSHSFIRIFNPVIYTLLLLLYLSYYRKSGSPFAKLFNRKSTKLLQTRRAELK